MGLINAAIPITIKISNIFAPTTFPTLILGIFFNVAVNEFANSGREVPIETSVNPMTTFGTPKAVAILTALSTQVWPQ